MGRGRIRGGYGAKLSRSIPVELANIGASRNPVAPVEPVTFHGRLLD
jgi:hypothetical protein